MPKKSDFSSIISTKEDSCAYCSFPIKEHTSHAAIACATSILENLKNE